MKWILCASLVVSLIGTSCTSTSTGPTGGTTPQVLIYNHFESANGSRGVWRVNSDGTGLKQILTAGYVSSAPRGNELVAVSSDSLAANPDIRVVNLDGGLLRALTSATQGDFVLMHPVLSPDGLHVVAYGANRGWPMDSGGMYVIDVDGTHGHWAPTNSERESEGAISPNGNLLAYYGSDKKFHIAHLDGSGAVAVGDSIFSGGDFYSRIQWSANGNVVYFDNYVIAKGYQTWRVNADGSGLVNLSTSMPSMAAVEMPLWSPDGNSLLCLSGTSAADIAMYVANADGSNMRKLMIPDSAPVYVIYSWSPDGKQIAFTSYKIGADPDFIPGTLYIVDVASSATRKLADSVSYGAYWAQ